MKKANTIEKLYEKIESLENKLKSQSSNVMTIPQLRKRDYIIRTKYYGKIKEESIKKAFKEEIEAKLKNSFSCICNNILNYEFSYDDGTYQCQDILSLFYKTLEQYEYKQIILDMYK